MTSPNAQPPATLLGIDVGTTKAAAVICDRTGRVLADESHPHGADLPAPAGRSEQDPRVLFDAAQNAVRRLPEELRRRVGAIGVTGQMHGVVALGVDLAPLAPLVTWQDQRCLEEGFLADVNARCGHVLRSGYGCATLAWLEAHGGLPREADSASTIHDWLVARLCGLSRPVTDPTDAASWGLFNLQDQDWDLPAAQAAGIRWRLLPAVMPCGRRAGGLTARVAEELGLPQGVPVAVAIGDNQASLLATLKHPAEELALTIGTGAQLSAIVARATTAWWPGRDMTYECRPFPERRTALVAASLCGGSAWTWLADAVESWLKDAGLPSPRRDELFDRLSALGLEAAGGPIVRPNFMGERHAPALRGSIEGIDLHNFSLGPLARGLARGIVANLSEMLPPEAFKGRSSVVGSGNALRKTPLLRAVEEVMGLPLRLSESREEAAAGAAINAAHLG